jgi:uncharacterized repeat protein (TIGR01451 family)
MFRLRHSINHSQSIQRKIRTRRPLLLTLLTVLMLAAVGMAGLSLSVRSSAESAGRAAKQKSASSSSASEGNRQATSETKAANQSSSPAALNDLLQTSASHHWLARNRYRFANPLVAASLSATKTDAIAIDGDSDTKADPGDTLEYTITINNTSAPVQDVTNVVFTDTLTDTNLQFVAGTVSTTPLARNDSYMGLVGNVSITKNAAGGVLTNDSDPDGVGPALTASAGTTSANGGNVTMNPDGSFVYDPPAGYEGTDSFTYTLSDGEGNTDTATVSFTIDGMVWFINNNGGACASNCDGRLSHPFTSLSGFQTVNDGNGNHPAADDYIFIYESAAAYTGPVTLLSHQRLIGQDATASLSAITGLTPPAGSPSFPGMDSGNGTIVKITSSTNAINTNSAGATNLIRGLTVGSTTGIGISGSNFGTLTVADTNMDDSPNRGGQALALSNGALSATFAGIRSTNSANAGIALTNVSGSLNTTTTSITNSGGIGISVDTSSATLSFGNTTSTQSNNTGVSLTTNTGTITFGSLNISPDGSQKGLLATNNSNTITFTSGAITTSSGVAVEITRSSGTTPLAVSLTNVSASGGANGIVLTNTSGSFTVAGTVSGTDRCGGLVTVNAVGTPATVNAPVIGECTGGTIQSTTGAGVAINNATNVSLTRMRILNSGTDGINVLNINGFTLNKSNVTDISGVAGDRGVEMGDFSTGTPVNGTINITNSTIGPTPHDNFGLGIASGTSTWNITGTVFTGSVLNTGFNMETRAATVSSFLMDGCVLQNQFADGMQIQPASGVNSTITSATIQNSTFQNNNIALDLNHDGTSSVTYKVLNNTLLNQVANSINFFSSATAGTSGTLNGRFVNNRIGDPAIFKSGGGIGIRININGGAAARVLLDSNVIRQIPDGRGIEIISRNGTGGTDATLINNQVNTDFVTTAQNQGFSLSNIFLQSNCLSICNTLRADIRGNNVPNTPPTGELIAFQLALIETGASTFQLVDNPPTPSANASTELTESHTNPAHNNTGNAGAGAGVTLISGPINAPPFAPPVQESRLSGSNEAEAIAIKQAEDTLAAVNGEGPIGKDAGKLNEGQLQAMLQVALERWRESGISAEDFMRLQAMTFEIADLPEGQLATATAMHAKIDETGAGYGWYLDPAAMTDEEFDVAVPGRELQTTEYSPAFGRMDLLTVVTRELGIAYKQGKKTVIKGLKPLMQNSLAPSVRRMPNSQKITLPAPPVGVSDASQSNGMTNLGAQASAESGQRDTSLNHAAWRMAEPNAPAAVGDVNLNIGTLPASKSITIKFRALIKSPLVTAAGSVSNQGSVTADGGISLNTDDPDVGGASNPTVTTLDVADVKVAKTDSPDPVLAGNNLTYTVTVTNDGPSAATVVQLTDTLPTNATVTFVSGQQTTGPVFTCTYPNANTSGGTVSCSIATLNSGASATFEIVLKVGAGTTDNTSLSNTATVSTTKTDPDSTNNTKTETTTVQARADLKLEKAGPPTASVGDPTGFDYILTVTNQGPSNNTGGFTVTDTLPTGVTFQSTGSSSECTAVGQVVTCTDNTGLAVLGVKVFTIHVTLNPLVVGGTDLQNTGTVASNGTTDQTAANNTATPVSTIAQANADLSITKSGPSTAVAGAPAGYDYTVTVTNNGPSANTGGFTVTDTLPTGLTFQSTGSSAGCSAVGQVVTCTDNTGLGVLGTKEFTIHVTVGASVADGTVLSNTASVASNGTNDPVSANNTTLVPVTTTVSTSADIEVTKTDSPDPVTAGTELTYTVTITNNGPSDAQNVNLIDAVPANTTFVSAAQDSGPAFNCTKPAAGASTGNVSCTIATLASGASAVFTIKVNVDANAANNSSISNTATGSSDTDDPNANNTADTETTTVQARADLKVDKSGPATAKAGDATGFDYTLTVTNLGPSNNTGGATVTDTLPGGLTFQSTGSTAGCSAVGQVVTCTSNAGMAVNGTKQYTVHVTLGSFALATTVLSNTATVASDGTADPTSGNDTSSAVTTTVEAEADLEVTKTDSPDPVVAGLDLTYTITVTNNGPSDAQSVELSDTVPTNTTFVSLTVPAGWTRSDNPLVPSGGTGTVKATTPTLAAGASAQITLVVKVGVNTPHNTTLSNTASVLSATTEVDNADNSDSETTTVQQRPDLSVTKTDAVDPIMIGENINYQVKVKNNGPSNATGVVFTDHMSPSLTFISATPTAGVCLPPVNSKLTCNLGNVNNGDTVTVDIVVKSGTAPNTIFNTARVEANEADADTSNNEVYESTRMVGFRNLFLFNQAIVTGGCQNSVGTLHFTSPAPAGVTINFVEFSSGVSIPSVTTVGGELSVQAVATTSMVTTEQLLDITAHTTRGPNSRVGRLKLLPVRIASLTFDQNPVQGGTPVTATLTLTCAAPSTIEVAVKTNKTAAKPDVNKVTFNVGDISKQFTITTQSPGVPVSPIITAVSSNGGYVRATLTVNP